VSHSDLSSKTCIQLASQTYILGEYGSHNELIKKTDTGGGYGGKFKKLFVPLLGFRESEMENKDKDTVYMEWKRV